MPNRTLPTLIVASAILFGPTAAMAQEVIIENDAAVVEEPAPIENGEAVLIDRPVGPRVYGWLARPIDCGTFHYWNGIRCADARDEPPVP